MGDGAVISADGRYRYLLTRDMEPLSTSPCSLTWVMLNPSTADAAKDDPTIRRVRGFSLAWGATRFAVVNLFAFRATHPRDLPHVTEEAEGPEWRTWTRRAMAESDGVVFAWGDKALSRSPSWGDVYRFAREAGKPVLCLRLTKRGEPWHPLYVPAATSLTPFPLPKEKPDA